MGFEPTYEGLKLGIGGLPAAPGLSFEPTYEGLKLERNA